MTAGAPADAQQLTFDLGHRAAQGRDDFLVTPGNQDAVAWIDLWPEWPGPFLVLQGPLASGKSHLAAVWAERSNAAQIAPARLCRDNPRDLFALGPAIVIDGIDPLIGDRAAETALFHLYNMAREDERSLLLTMQTAPIRQNFALPDLASRLRAAPAAAIQPPDDALLAAILVKLFNDRQMAVGADVIQYALPRMERSFAAASDLVARTDALTLSEKRSVTIPVIRGLLINQSGA